jgi:hypothetical protein
MTRDLKVTLVIVLSSLALSTLLVFALTAVFGAPSMGLRCERTTAARTCEIRQSRFLGFIGNSSVVIPEAQIDRAVTLRPRPAVGRGSGSYTVSLELNSGPYRNYPVMGGRFFTATDAATRKLNAYLADPSATSVEVHEDMAASLLMPLLPVGLAVLAGAFAALWRRKRAAPP